MELICLMSSRILLDSFKELRIAGQVVGFLMSFPFISRISLAWWYVSWITTNWYKLRLVLLLYRILGGMLY